VLSRKGLSCFEKNNALVKLYEAEKAKTANLSDAGYRIKKINLLQSLILQAQTKVLTEKYNTP